MSMAQHQHDQHDPALEAPIKLVAALKRLPKPDVFIPPTIDEAVLRVARKRLEERGRISWVRFLPWLAAAATAVVLLIAIPRLFPKSGLGFAKEDLNHDGQVDILDAFALARQLKTDGMANPQMDINGDGVVDERDVAILAAHAVKLEKGGRS